MKTFLLLIIAVGAFSAQKPVITLDTTNLVEAKLGDVRFQQHGSNARNWRSSSEKKADYVFECVFDAQSCDAPVASATDHHQGKIAVKATYFTIARNGAGGSTEQQRFPKSDDEKVLLGPKMVHTTQIIKYDATDRAGNKAEQLVVAFFIWDNEAPTITVCGPSPQTLNAVFAAYKDSVSAYDNIPVPFLGCNTYQKVGVSDMVDSNLESTLTTTIKLAGTTRSSIDLNVVGTWTIDYTATDTSGNVGRASKNVIILDNTPPNINRNGAANIRHECATPYTDAGAVCTDLRDGPIAVQTFNDVDSSYSQSEKTYTITYNCKDQLGHTAAEVRRSVTVKDDTAPIIKLQGSANIQLWAGELVWTAYGTDYNKGDHTKVAHEWRNNNKNDQWVTCTDTCDKNPSITFSFNPKFESKVPGKYTETYACEDAQGMKVTVDRIIDIIDNHKPVMKLHGSDPLTIEAAPGYKYEDEGASCTDEVDHDLSHKVVVSGKVVNGAEPGTYMIHYNCADKQGNDGDVLDRQVIVRDTTKPTIYITSSKYMVIEASFPWSDPGATAYDSLDGDLTSRIQSPQASAVNPFDANKNKNNHGDQQITGYYTIDYNVEDDVGNDAVTVTRTVVVKDTLPPVIVVDHPESGKLGSGDQKYNVHPYDDPKYGAGYSAKSRNADGYILAEESTAAGVNGWVIGAVASAVTGLALLGYAGYSMKKTGYTAVTSVPV